MAPGPRFQEIVGSSPGLTFKNDEYVFSRLNAPELLYKRLDRPGGGEKGGSESVPHPAAPYIPKGLPLEKAEQFLAASGPQNW